MQLESWFGVFMIWILIGGVLALITYYMLKIHIAYKMVVVANLEKFSGYDEYVDVLMASKKQTEGNEKPKEENINQ